MNTLRGRSCLPLVLLAVAATASASAAQAFDAAGGPLGAAVRLRSEVPGHIEEHSGLAVGGEGALSLGRLLLEADYWQGTLDSDAAGVPSRDLVEGKALLGVRPFAWLALKAGPHVRSYVTGGVTQRWVFWEARASAQSPLVAPAVTGYLELWRALSADVNVPEAFDRAQGGEAGLRLRPGAGPLRARLGYRIEHSQFGGAARVETVEQLVFGLGLELR